MTRVVPAAELQDAAMDLARQLLAKAPLAMGLAKTIMNTCDSIDTASGRILERIGQSVLIRTEDHKEGIRAFREKRKGGVSGPLTRLMFHVKQWSALLTYFHGEHLPQTARIRVPGGRDGGRAETPHEDRPPNPLDRRRGRDPYAASWLRLAGTC